MKALTNERKARNSVQTLQKKT